MKELTQIRNNFQYFPYHLVTPSPWPILTSFSLLTTTIGAVMYMHGYNHGDSLLSLGLLLTFSGMSFWFRDVITEGTMLGDHTQEVVIGLFYGIILFIVSEVFAFFSVFWAFFHSSLSPAIEIGGIWPPLGITPLNPFAIPLLNTFLLLSSGASITYGHHALISGKRSAAIEGMLITIIFAIIFTALQAFEYNQAPFTLADSIFGSAFFITTGLHGLHVIVGTIFISFGYARFVKYHLTNKHHLGLENGILYWHFVDVVWLFLFIGIYMWGGLGVSLTLSS